MRPKGDRVCAKCGGLYWRKAEQWHVCAMVVNTPEVVVNEVVHLVVNKRSKDRHKTTRLEYARLKMREYRERLKKRRAEKAGAV